MSYVSVPPKQCPNCRRTYDFHNKMLTFSCGHSQCAACTKNIVCCTCCKPKKIVPALDVATFVCAGCNRHYINHYDTVINQVRILSCGHRRMCNHGNSKCAVCAKKVKEVAIDVSLTALVCRVCITDPSLPKRKEKQNAWLAWCCQWKKKKYENI